MSPATLDITSQRAPAPTSIGRIVLLVVFAAAVFVFFYFDLTQYLSLEALKANRDWLLAYTESHSVSAVLIYIALYCLQTVFSLPGAAVFTLAGGFLFGAVLGTVYANIGATLGATFAFLAARTLLRDWVERKFGERLRPIQEGFEQNGFYYLLTLRLIPLFPFFLVNLMAGLTRISVGEFVAATAIGIVPAAFVFANAGRQLGSINSLGEIASPRVLAALALLGVLAIVPILYRRYTAGK